MDQRCSPYQSILNLSDPVSAKEYLPDTSEGILLFILLPFVLVTGLVGNLAFLTAVFRIARMRTLTNLYLAQVAVTDIIFIALSTASYIQQRLDNSVRYGVSFKHWIGCYSTFLVSCGCYIVSLFLVTLVTVERFYAICYPLKMRRITGEGRSTKILAYLWIGSVLTSAIAAQRYSRLQVQCVIWPSDEEHASLPQIVRFCVAAYPLIQVISELLLCSPYVILLPLNLYMYSMIICSLSNRLPMNEMEQANSIQTKKVRNQVARLLIYSGVVFFICQSLIRLVSINNIIQELAGLSLFTPSQYAFLLLIGRIMLFINSAVNPYIYVATSPFYKNAIFEAISCKRRRHEARNEQLSMNTKA